MKKEMLGVRIPADLKKRISAEATALGMPMSVFVTLIFNKYLQSFKEEEK